MKIEQIRWVVGLSILILALGALPVAAETVYSGIDTWVTHPNGQSFHDFSRAPLPSGFFCAGSEPFTGRVALRGVPLASDEPKLLGDTDTIIERLDDAPFDRMGVAATRVRVRALSLASIAPIQTACGAYDVHVTLTGQQPVTTMRIFKEGADSGRFLAPLALQVKITFTPVSGLGRALEVVRPVRFDANPRNQWSLRPMDKLRGAPSRLLVDTDGDNVPDTYVKGPSNFRAGVRQAQDKSVQTARTLPSDDPNCHLGQDAYHCPDGGGGYVLY